MPIRRIAVALVCLAVGAVVVVLAVGGDEEPARPPTATPTPTPTPNPVALDRPTDRPSLAVGITEPNANLISAGFTSALPSIWERRRDQLVDIRPQLYRFVVLWSSVQPRPAAAPNLALENGGCSRTIPPCAPWAGIRDELRALAARQQQGGWEAMMVISGMPPWAASSVQGCTRGTYPTAAGPRPVALRAYRRLIADVLALARSVGASVRYVSPWNEPNHPFFLAPQRAVCDAASPSLAVAPYAALASAAKAELAVQPGDQRLVLGETAGILEPTARATSVAEFVRGLPRGLVCGTTVWSQHGYIGGTDPVAETARRARRAALPAPARDLDHRDRRRPRAGRPVAGPRDHQRGAGVPAAAPAAARLVPRPAGDRGGPVHVPRGRDVPDRARHGRPRTRAPGACRVAGLGRPPEPRLATTKKHLPQLRGSDPLTCFRG